MDLKTVMVTVDVSQWNMQNEIDVANNKSDITLEEESDNPDESVNESVEEAEQVVRGSRRPKILSAGKLGRRKEHCTRPCIYTCM